MGHSIAYFGCCKAAFNDTRRSLLCLLPYDIELNWIQGVCVLIVSVSLKYAILNFTLKHLQLHVYIVGTVKLHFRIISEIHLYSLSICLSLTPTSPLSECTILITQIFQGTAAHVPLYICPLPRSWSDLLLHFESGLCVERCSLDNSLLYYFTTINVYWRHL